MMCDGRSSPTWTTNSPRSVSTTRTPAGSSASFSSISSVTIDFDFTASRTPALARDARDDPRARRRPSPPSARGSRAPRRPRGRTARDSESRRAMVAARIAPRLVAAARRASASAPKAPARPLARRPVVSGQRLAQARIGEGRVDAAMEREGGVSHGRHREHLGDVPHADAAAAPVQAAADVHQAADVGGHDRVGAAALDGVDLRVQHRARQRPHLDGEQAAEAAARFGVRAGRRIARPRRRAAGGAAARAGRGRAGRGRTRDRRARARPARAAGSTPSTSTRNWLNS